LLLIFLCIPFGQILGLSVPFGFLIAYLGFRYAFSQKIGLPQFLLKKKISKKILEFILKQLLFFMKVIAKLSHPRLIWISTHRGMRQVNGSLIGLIGIFLAISPPIPLMSYIASAALLFLGIGLLNDDGIWIFIGYLLTISFISLVIVTQKYISISDIIHSFK